MGLTYKRVPFEVKEIVDLAGGGWEIAGYASTFGGSPDEQGDVVARGAFADSIAERKTKLLYEHAVPIGRQLELREDEHGLFGRWSIVDTVAGTDAYKLAKGGVLDSLSIGYVPKETAFSPDDGTRILLKVDLYEVSAVAIPANTNAVITNVKADQKATWSTSYVNDLPDSSFALIMPGGSKDDTGKTTPRSLRKLPHHDSSGAVDAPHVRNGLSRAPQMTGVSDAQRSRAVSHLTKHLAALDKAARVHRKSDDWDDDDDEGISTFAAGSYEALAEDLEEAFEAVAISSGQMGYAEVVATFADHFVAVITLLDASGQPNPVLAEDPVYWSVPYTVAADGTITLGTQTKVEPEATFVPADGDPTKAARRAPGFRGYPDDGKSLVLAHRFATLTRRLERRGILTEAAAS